MSRLAHLALAAVLGMCLAAALSAAIRSCAGPPALTVGTDVPAGTTRVLDAGRAPTRRDTAAVSGTGGDVAAVRIEYRDRWPDLPAPACPDGTAAVPDSSTRVVIAPDEAPPLAALPNRPVRVSPSRVVLTYQEAEGETPGRTVQEVYRVPRERLRLWGDLGAGVDLPPPLAPLSGSWQRPLLEARVGLDVRPELIPGAITLELRHQWRWDIADSAHASLEPVAQTTGWLRWRPLDWRR